MNREWAIPVALGLVVAAGLFALPDDDGEEGQPGAPTATGTTTGPAPALLSPFAESLGPSGEEASFLVLAPRGRAAAEAVINETGAAEYLEDDDVDWVNDRLAYYKPHHAVAGCHVQPDNRTLCSDPVWAMNPSWPLPKPFAPPDGDLGPRLGMDGYNATRATIYVFDERGLLFATNDSPGNWSRFAGAPTTMEPAVWYIGAHATAPNGTQKPPSFSSPLVERLRPLMEGLPVGGVASTQSNAYVSLYGTLFLTIRIDELVQAP